MIVLTSDIHGHLGLEWLSNELSKIALTDKDHLIILGDAGIVWDEKEHPEVKDYYDSLPCSTLFLDGNHENFDILDSLPIIYSYGGKVHRISDKISHLMRGETYTIEDRTFFVFGGGYSAKKKDGTSPVFVWEREMPNKKEYDNGTEKLRLIGNSVDYIITHVAPTEIASRLGKSPLEEEIELNDYLTQVSTNNEYSEWYFGHYHTDVDLGKYHSVYRKIRVLP